MTQIWFALASLICSSCYSQFTLMGHVRDDEGLPYEHIAVVIEQTQQSTITDEHGFYSIENMAPGIYALSIDYLYDKQYYTVTIPKRDTSFNIALTRRIEFNEILVKAYQMDVSKYSSASRLNTEQLQTLNKDKDLPYVLKNISGIAVQSDAGNGIGYTGIRMRGLDPSHVQVNINGIPFNDNESSISYFVDIPDIISQAEEITVFKGNVPNRAGTPSFGGAIDINTNKLIFQPFLLLKIQSGSYHSLKYNMNANSGLLDNKYNFEIGLSRQKSNGYIDRSDSDLKSFRISGAVIKNNYSIRLNYLHGSERTGQAWNGLPIQYAGIDSLRRFNTAGTEKPGSPYEDEKDNYKQDHIQLFYQKQLNAKMTLNTSLNFTKGSGYYENYKSGQDLRDYDLESSISTSADLVKRQWLENDFVFANAGLQYLVHKKLSFFPSISWSYYNGDHFGQVAKVLLTDYNYLRSHYYDNNGLKKEFSACIKAIYKASDHLHLSLDIQYRDIQHRIDGQLEFSDSLFIDRDYKFFNPKVFAEYDLNKNLQFYSSVGLMGREPFREDLIGEEAELKHEELLDIELGTKLSSSHFNFKLNGYWMNYNQQIALSGRINDVGEALRVNLGASHRLGLELELEYRFSNWLSLWFAGNLSTNKISEITEFIPEYDSAYNLLGYDKILHKNTDISFSPASVIQEGISMSIMKEKKNMPGVMLKLNHSYLSDFYLDNYSKQSSLLQGYHNFDCTLSVQKSYSKIGTLDFWITLYNFTDEKYSSHGWISRERHRAPMDLMSSPYLGQESNEIYYYKGLYPQALRHFNVGLSLNFH